MSTDGVEVAQEDGIYGSSAVAIVRHDVLADLLGVAVGAFGLLAWCSLGDGKVLGVGLSIDRAAGGEYDAFHLVVGHELEEVHQADRIVIIVFQRLHNAFAYGLGGCKVDDTFDAGIFLEYAFKGGHVGAVHLFEGGTYASDAFNAVKDVLV